MRHRLTLRIVDRNERNETAVIFADGDFADTNERKVNYCNEMEHITSVLSGWDAWPVHCTVFLADRRSKEELCLEE